MLDIHFASLRLPATTVNGMILILGDCYVSSYPNILDRVPFKVEFRFNICNGFLLYRYPAVIFFFLPYEILTRTLHTF